MDVNSITTKLTELLNLSFPMIMAPMFLVSNEKMVSAAINSGIAGCFPTLNYRTEKELDEVLKKLNETKKKVSKGNYGVNLIVQQTNIYYKKHLQICVANKVPFYITSLGNPEEVIKKAHEYGALVFCDVTNLKHAEKCASLHCDGFIAVGQGAGGHAGPNPLQILIPALKRKFPHIPVIAAGGIANGCGVLSSIALGAAGVSVGTAFIASLESDVNQGYKDAILNSGMDDIVMTDKISGTPCTIINTPYAKKIGYKQNFIERFLSNSPSTKKLFKSLIQYRGLRLLEKSVMPANYKTLWCAGKSVELIDELKTINDIITKMKDETFEAMKSLENSFK